jgi:hypothetical protein
MAPEVLTARRPGIRLGTTMAEETSSESEADSMADHPPPPYVSDSSKTATTAATTVFQCPHVECSRRHRLRMTTYAELTEHLRDVHRQFTPVPDDTSQRAEKARIREARNDESGGRPMAAAGNVSLVVTPPGQAHAQSPYCDATQNMSDRKEIRESMQQNGMVISDRIQPGSKLCKCFEHERTLNISRS